MVKLTGPAASIGAAGSLAGVLTFSSSKGKRYLKRKSKPTQPRTKPQVSIRAAMAFLSPEWKRPIQTIRDSWIPSAAATQISPFNAYISANCLRHRNMQGLHLAYPATELGNIASPVSFAATGHVRRVHFTFDITNLNQNWGLYIHWVSNTGIEPKWEDTVHIIPTYSTGIHEWDWKPVDAGTYWFTDSRTTYTGKFSRVGRWRSAVVTD